MASWRLDWQHGRAELNALGGMLGPVTFRLPDGRDFSPLYMAPWSSEEIDPALPPLMHGLRGEWPCVPFGRTDFPTGLQNAGWQEQASWPGLARPSTSLPATSEVVDARAKPGHDAELNDPHGYAANHAWSLIDQGPRHLSIAIDYPATLPIARLERGVTADEDGPALDLTLTIHAREDVTLPVALHPTFDISGGVELCLGKFKDAIAYPIPAEANVSRLSPNAATRDLHAMPSLDGTIDLTRLPLDTATEELLQLKDCKPPFSLYYEKEGVTMSLWWDQQQLPDVMLWISNGGRAYHPWNGRNYALGVEPVNGAFDLGRVGIPPAAHPLSARRGLALRKGEPIRIDYRLAVQ